jgi:hypothetical protein
MSSKFSAILDRKKEREEEPQEAVAEVAPPPTPAPAKAAPAKKRGRPAGKRSDADYVQTTAYIHKDTHRDVKIALLKSGSELDFSELVDDLLGTWLKSNR